VIAHLAIFTFRAEVTAAEMDELAEELRARPTSTPTPRDERALWASGTRLSLWEPVRQDALSLLGSRRQWRQACFVRPENGARIAKLFEG
jgi:hypothetical protein